MNPYWLAPAVVIGVPLVAGPLGAWLRLLRPDTGFFLLGMALFLALAASAGLAAATAYATVTARPWRRSALRAALLPAAVALGSVAFLQWKGGADLNDVSTDLEQRPAFAGDPPQRAALAESEQARLALFAKTQRRAYPDLAPLLVPGPPGAAFASALAAAGRMPGWRIERTDPGRGEIEASATTRVFGFVDDVAIRVRGEPAGARIDVRSRSRLGRADFGANAARVREFMGELRGRLR